MKVLIADDENIVRFRLEKFLQDFGYEVLSVSNGEAAWELIQSPSSPDLLILDWEMPGMDGLVICRETRKLNSEYYTYILLLSSRSEPEDIIEGMEAGADDYITKPFNKEELRVRLRAGRRIVELNREVVDSRNLLKEKAAHDALTGLANRGKIEEVLDKELERAKRKGSPLCLAMIDIDHFKKVNDTYGHLAGDQVLRKVSKMLLADSRPYDVVGRYGGEEFLLLMPDYDIETTLNKVERLRKTICQSSITTSEGVIVVSISTGVCLAKNLTDSDMNDLIKTADLALYKAKNNGRNRTEIEIVGQ